MAEHHHHHNHSHEHAHHHHGADCTCIACTGIDITSHEGALIGTCTGHIPADSLDAAKAQLSDALRALAARINEAGGVIGHIKAVVLEEGRGFQISVTDEDAEVRELLPSAYRADCTAIVFAVEEDALRAFMKSTLMPPIIPDPDDDCDCDDCSEEHEHES